MPKTLKIQTTSGQKLTLKAVDDHGLSVAMTAQEPNYSVLCDDGSIVHLNCRTVETWSESAGDGQPQTEDEAEPEQKMIPDADPAHDPDRTVAQLKEALDAAEVEYPSGAVKAELQELARKNKV